MLYSLSLLYFLILIIHAFGLSFSAPEACGNNHIIVHATALFGPTLQAANVFNARLFAPRPQANGLYLSINDISATTLQPLFNACIPLTVSSDIYAIKGDVAVVTRGVCDFSTKVVNMQHAGAIAVIVVNFPDTNRLQHMKLNESIEQPIIYIPAVMINYRSWASIAPCQNQTTVSFTSDGEASFNIDYGREALNWAMMRGVVLLIVILLVTPVIFKYRRMT